MTPEARVAAAIEVLDDWLSGTAIEPALKGWSRRNRYAGSSDRAAIRDWVFSAIRRKRMAAAHGGGESGRALMIGMCRLLHADPDRIFTGEGYGPPPLSDTERAGTLPSDLAPAVLADWPDWLWADTVAVLGKRVMDQLELMKLQAPVILRVNLARTTREDAAAALLLDDIETAQHDLSPAALTVTTNTRRVSQSEAYRSGLVELQDAASQAVVDFADPRPGETVLDYCAGGGGKTLAIAARTGARVTAHDANPGRMADLPERAKRAQADVRIVTDPSGVFDLVFCDVPCSGSGSWRRDPAGKWRLTPDDLARLNRTQAEILDKATGCVAPKGRLAYATCSILPAENADQIAGFLIRNPDWEMLRSHQFTPLDGGDGFFIAVLARKS